MIKNEKGRTQSESLLSLRTDISTQSQSKNMSTTPCQNGKAICFNQSGFSLQSLYTVSV